MLAQAESARKVEKTLSLERILEEKGQSVLDKHLKRQEQLRAKNETAMARAKANESKLIAQRQEVFTQMQQLYQE